MSRRSRGLLPSLQGKTTFWRALCEQKGIKVTTNWTVDSVEADRAVISSVTGDEIPLRPSVTIPPNLGQEFSLSLKSLM